MFYKLVHPVVGSPKQNHKHFIKKKHVFFKFCLNKRRNLNDLGITYTKNDARFIIKDIKI